MPRGAISCALEHGLLCFTYREAQFFVLFCAIGAHLVSLKCLVALLSFCAIAGTVANFNVLRSTLYLLCIVLQSTIYYFSVPVRARSFRHFAAWDNLPASNHIFKKRKRVNLQEDRSWEASLFQVVQLIKL